MDEGYPKKYQREVRREEMRGKNGDSLSDEWWEDIGSEMVGPERLFEYLEQDLTKHGLRLNPEVKILDIGSGQGLMLEYLKKRGLDVVGVDARPRGKRDLPQVQARAERLPFADEKFDVIISYQLFDSSMYRQDQAEMINEITRVLKKGGIYVGNTELIHVPTDELVLVSNPSEKKEVVVYKKL